MFGYLGRRGDERICLKGLLKRLRGNVIDGGIRG